MKFKDFVLNENLHYREMTDTEILREAIQEELKAANLYEQMARYVKDNNLRTVLLDVAREEKVHAEEFEEMLEMLDKDYEEADEQAEEEIENMGIR